jgi:hypothetical protein
VALEALLYFECEHAILFNGRFDRARGVEIGNKDIKLEHLEEAFTTSNWIVRIYKVKPPNNRWWGGSLCGIVKKMVEATLRARVLKYSVRDRKLFP